MMSVLLVGLCASAAALLVPSSLNAGHPGLASARVCNPRLQLGNLPFIPPPNDDSDDDELDAWDFGDSWEQQEAEQRAWEERMAAEKEGAKATKATPPADRPPPVNVVDDDFEANAGAYFDDEVEVEADSDRAARQLAEKFAAEALMKAQAASAAPSDKNVMTSLEAVLATMARLETKVDKLTAKVDLLAMQPPSIGSPSIGSPTPSPGTVPPPPTSALDGWDGEVDEEAYFDYDDYDDDQPDWRDVRAAKKAAGEL